MNQLLLLAVLFSGWFLFSCSSSKEIQTNPTSNVIITEDAPLPGRTGDRLSIRSGPLDIRLTLNRLFAEQKLRDTFTNYYTSVTNNLISYYVFAQRAFSDGENDLAIHLLDRAVELSKTEELFLLKAYIYNEVGDFANANRSLANARVFSPENLQLYEEIGFQLEQAVLSRTEPSTFINPYFEEAEENYRFAIIGAGFFLEIPGFASERMANRSIQDIKDYYDFTLNMSIENINTVPIENRVSIFIGPYEDEIEATIQKSRLIMFYRNMKIVRNM